MQYKSVLKKMPHGFVWHLFGLLVIFLAFSAFLSEKQK